MSSFSPREIVSELDRFIIGQKEAKRAVAIALRKRWRRQQLEGDMREEVMPKNILMIGPTGVGKTEISRRSPASRRALHQGGSHQVHRGRLCRPRRRTDHPRPRRGRHRPRAREDARGRQGPRPHQREERVLEALVGKTASPATRDSFRKKLRDGEMDDKEIEIEVADTGSGGMPNFEIPGMPGANIGVMNINDMLSKAMGGKRTKTRKTTVKEILRLPDRRRVRQAARPGPGGAEGAGRHAERRHRLPRRDRQDRGARGRLWRRRLARGRAARSLAVGRGYDGGDQVRAGEDRPHPFIASGAFHVASLRTFAGAAGPPADRVELRALEKEDFRRILTEPETSLIASTSR